MSTSFARDYHMKGEIAATRDGRILGVRVDVLADHGAFNGTAQPTKFPAGFFHIFTGSYDLEAAYCKVTGVYTNKAPGGVAYACSFRITEAVYLVERMVDLLADELGVDPAELRLKNLLRPEQFPYVSKTGWEYDSGDYPRALKKAMEIAGYDELRREQREKRERGELMGIGISFFTEGVGAGPRKHMDILGLGMADGCELRLHPTGKAQLRLSVQTQGQGHETTFAQIVSHELGIPPEDIDVIHGDTSNTPFGLGTYGSRSTPVSGAAAAVAAQRVRDKARVITAAALECSPDDLEWEQGRWYVKGDPSQGKTIAEVAMLAHGTLELPEGVEGHLDASVVYDPPNLTYPFGAYICVVDVDPGTGQVTVRRFIAVDDCGPRINPMIVEGQVHGGLADGVGMALMQVIAFDEDGNCVGGFLHGLPAADLDGVPELGDGGDGDPVAAPPPRPEGDRRVRHRRLAAGGGERGDRRARAVRRAARGHAADPGQRVDGDAGPADAHGSGGAVSRPDVERRAADLRAERVPYVHATVVLAERPTSAKPGDEAIVFADGTIEGFVGGTCAESTVRAQGLALLDSRGAAAAADQPDAGAGAGGAPRGPADRAQPPACRAGRSRSSWSRSCRHRCWWCTGRARSRPPSPPWASGSATRCGRGRRGPLRGGRRRLRLARPGRGGGPREGAAERGGLRGPGRQPQAR